MKKKYLALVPALLAAGILLFAIAHSVTDSSNKSVGTSTGTAAASVTDSSSGDDSVSVSEPGADSDGMEDLFSTSTISKESNDIEVAMSDGMKESYKMESNGKVEYDTANTKNSTNTAGNKEQTNNTKPVAASELGQKTSSDKTTSESGSSAVSTPTGTAKPNTSKNTDTAASKPVESTDPKPTSSTDSKPGTSGSSTVTESNSSDKQNPVADTKPTETKPTETKPIEANPAETKPVEPAPAPHTHTYSSAVTKQPNCTSEGCKTYTCSCGNQYTEVISKTAHTWQTTTSEKWVVDQAAYDEPVKQKIGGYQCNDCGQRYTYDECSSGALDAHMKATSHGASSSWSEVQIVTVHHDEIGHTESVSTTSCSTCGAHL